MAVLVTGGAGYIGSHTCVELLNENKEIIIVDNFCNSKPEVLNRIKKITGKDFKFYQVDLLDRENLEKIFAENKIDSVIHFAGLKAVGESVSLPLKYYHNNITGTLILCEIMIKYNVKKIVFSSSATVYGIPKKVPITEDMPLSAINPYGRTKLMIEEILRDIFEADKDWSISLLRYFNPVGAHKSGTIGENPNGIPNNIMPRIIATLSGKLDALTIYGTDYPTIDGTGVRDYIHVVDLAKGHLKALELVSKKNSIFAHNLGTGNGYSVMQMIDTFEKVNNVKIKQIKMDRRTGDAPECYADPAKAKKELGWEAKLGLEEMCEDSYRWYLNNPNGY